MALVLPHPSAGRPPSRAPLGRSRLGGSGAGHRPVTHAGARHSKQLDLAVRVYADPALVAPLTKGLGGAAGHKGQALTKGRDTRPGSAQRARLARPARVRVPAPARPLSKQYRLVWADEFDYNGPPDPRRWGFQTDANEWTTDGIHGEEQWYTRNRKKNAWVNNGTLKIRALREDWEVRPRQAQRPATSSGHDSPARARTNAAASTAGASPAASAPPPSGGSKVMQYTSARLSTKGRGEWLYGKVEVCARLPAPRRGAWPAIWMLPSGSAYGAWPRSGEIDLMEAVGHKPGVVHATLHTAPPPEGDTRRRSCQYGHAREIPDAHVRFVVYSVVWTPEEVRILADGHCVLRCKRGPDAGRTMAGGAPSWPFDQPFHLVLNVAIGGSWGGVAGVDPEVCPCVLEVAWVRVHQLQ